MTIWKQNLFHVLRLMRKGKKCAMNKRYLVVRKELGTIDGMQVHKL